MSDAPRIPLARPVIGPEEEQAVLDVLRSGQLSLGPRLGEFERRFAARIGVPHGSAVSSGTAGLHLALRAVGVERGAGDREVVTSPFSFIATANSVLYEEATPVFVDVDPDTLNVSADAVASAVTSRTVALLPVHIFGYPAEIAGMERHGLPIVEDAAEALGAVHADGTPVGGHGHPTMYAFYANKQMTTGEGGMVTTADPAIKARIDSERNQGRAPDMQWLDHDRLGFNYRMSDIACALGIAQLGRLDDMLASRAQVAAWYREALAGLVDRTGVELLCEDRGGARRSWFVFVVRVPRGVDRDATISRLAERGIQTRPYLPAIHLFAFYRERLGFREGQFPVAEDAAARGLSLPFFPGMTQDQVATVVAELTAVLTGD
ncbi:DegT/DnrJ/EryC1/StrS family aminotransferase [Patulibacter sp. SYSU D01012]|uniref:DegT/DnrJ/EryC1/StrS family aminotransferase n=1 Tax=Patulibacter sp. SYSU D01012 TaxID=2817381 RepID=UPI001B3092BB|nr:DegT/DnrJ/EryC1/StrS family aminotransferase [Patulibacter sp. SYSU D01012]